MYFHMQQKNIFLACRIYTYMHFKNSSDKNNHICFFLLFYFVHHCFQVMTRVHAAVLSVVTTGDVTGKVMAAEFASVIEGTVGNYVISKDRTMSSVRCLTFMLQLYNF